MISAPAEPSIHLTPLGAVAQMSEQGELLENE